MSTATLTAPAYDLKAVYHVFTNNRDEWLDTYEEALQLFNEWAAEYGSARLYGEEYAPDDDSEPVNEECLQSFGYYPL